MTEQTPKTVTCKHGSSLPRFCVECEIEGGLDECAEIVALKRERSMLSEENLKLRERVAELEGIISAVSCDEATIKDCERYCWHGMDKLHAEGRAIRGRI